MNRRRLLWAALAVLMAIAVSSCSNEQKAPQAPERPYIPQVYTAAGLQEAVKSGGTVKLANDIVLPAPDSEEKAALVIEKDTTINLNGKTIKVGSAQSAAAASIALAKDTRAEVHVEQQYILEVKSGTLTISGNGTIDGYSSRRNAIRVGTGGPEDNAKLIINGGTFKGKDACIHLNGGHVSAVINGGTFSSEEVEGVKKHFTLDKEDDYKDSAMITVNGGTFLNGFNPMSHSNDTGNDNYVADGYYTEYDDGNKTYTVRQRPSGTAGYKVVWDQAGLNAVCKEKKASGVLLGADIKLGYSGGDKAHGFLITEKDVTLDLNGHKLTADKPGEGKKHYMEEGGNMPYAILAVHDKTLTVNDSSSAKTGMIDGETGGYGGIWIHNGDRKNAKLVFKNGFVRCADNAVYLSGEEAQAIIRGGKFWADEDTERNKYYTLNILDENAKGDSPASFTVTGGSFYNFDPAANYADSSSPNETCYIDKGKYHTVSSPGDGGTWYVVIPGAASN